MNTQAIETLSDNIESLQNADKLFAKDLLASFKSKGSLSEKQWYWVGKLAERSGPFMAPVQQAPSVQLGEFQGVIALFDKAKEHLKYPKINLQLVDGSPVCLSVAGPSAKHPGTVNVTDGGPYGTNKWYGRVGQDGAWVPSVKALAIENDLTNLLAKLAKNPARVAAEYGKLSGNCCFCHTKLTDEKSTDVGYGPVCAKKWGLKWGKTVQVTANSSGQDQS